MTTEQQMVREFMMKAGQECPNKPTMVSSQIGQLRLNLIHEETNELDQTDCNMDLTEVADVIGDLFFVVLGAAVAYGINIQPIFDEIMRSNMTKFIDGHKREDGKWIKGPSYTPANLKPIIDSQVQSTK